MKLNKEDYSSLDEIRKEIEDSFDDSVTFRNSLEIELILSIDQYEKVYKFIKNEFMSAGIVLVVEGSEIKFNDDGTLQSDKLAIRFNTFYLKNYPNIKVEIKWDEQVD